MSPFIHRSSNFCPRCNRDRMLIVMCNGPRDKINLSKFKCKHCKTEYDIDWTDRRHPRPIFTGLRYKGLLYNVQNYF